MKIFNVMFTTLPGGLEQAFLDYTDALTVQGHEVTPLIHTQSAIAHKINGQYYSVHSFSKYDPISLFKLKRIIQKDRPDVIVTHGNRAHYLMQKAAGKIPVIGVVHNPSFGPIMNGRAIICVSNELKEECYKRQKKDLQQIVHIPNMKKFPENMTYKIPHYSSPIVIGMAARLFDFKGGDVFVKALNILKLKNIPFKAKIAGDGPEFKNITALIKSLNLENDIEMLGWIDNLESFYNQLDIYCIPSLTEPFGLVILEGFTHSIPLVVSDASGPMEIVKHEHDALVFPKGDHTQLALSIERLINEPDLAGHLTQNGFDTLQKYDMKVVGKTISDFLKSLI